MNILFITEDHSLQNYGVTAVLSQLADELARWHDDIRVTIAATGSSAVPQHRSVTVELIPPIRWARGWRWSPNLPSRIKKIVYQRRIDLIHIHGVWSAGPWCGLKAAQQMKIPAIVSTHGMWEQWFWKHDSPTKILKKKLYFHWVLKRAIPQNTIMHALNSAERLDIRNLLPHNRISVIPNAIRVEQDSYTSMQPERMILFLGRLHPKKGIELLIRAFAQAELQPEWQLVIAGPEESPTYAHKLKGEVIRAGLSNRVKFIGPVFGAAKKKLMQKAWVQVLPTYSEGQAMVNLEAAIRGIPSITTWRAGLENWQDGGGLLVEPISDELANSLFQVCNWSLKERNERGKQLRQWVIENYSLETVMPKWEKLYKMLEISNTQ